MKSCNYYYKGKLIGDIAQLDDFLISKQMYYSKYGDKVFQTVPSIHNIITEASKKNQEAQKAWNKRKKEFINDEELIKLNRPFVGVTEFLSGQRNEAGDLYFPEFRKDYYWDKRFHAWTNAKKATAENHSDGFTQDEIDLFFDGDESKITAIPLGNTDEWFKANGEYKEDFGSDEQKRLRDLITDKWKHQAEFGTDIHNVLEEYFKIASDPAQSERLQNLENWSNKGFTVTNFIKNNLKNKITPITNEEKIKQIIQIGKELREELESRYEGPLTYYPEVTLSAKLNKEYEGRTDLSLVGRVDLLVIDKHGNPHIIDYKASPKSYSDYNLAKKLGFTYQLATYGRMLRRLGIDTGAMDLLVAPIKMVGLNKNSGNWDYETIERGSTSTQLLQKLPDDTKKLNDNLDEFIEAPVIVNGHSENLVESVLDAFKKWFPKYGNTQYKSDEEVKELIKERGGFKQNKDTGQYEYQLNDRHQPITAKSESELFTKVKKEYNKRKERSIKNTKKIVKAIQNAKSKGNSSVDLEIPVDNWFMSIISKYMGSNWTILDNDAALACQEFGMILFQNNLTGVIEVIKISASNLKYLNNWGENRSNLSGALEVDITENSNTDSRMLKALNGNIELMEAMVVLNNLNFSQSIVLNKIHVINPGTQSTALAASNKELLYNWKRLQKLNKLDGNDLYMQGKIKLTSKVEQLMTTYQDIMSRANKRDNAILSKHSKLFEEVDNLKFTDKYELLNKLNELRRSFEKEHTEARQDMVNGEIAIHSGLRDYDSDYIRTLYQLITNTILELNNMDVRQAYINHHPYLENSNFIKDGLSGVNLDNAGNFTQDILNQLTSLVLEGYQNARDTGFRKLNELRQKTEALKKAVGYSKALEYTVGNQTSLYDGMTKYTQDGDLRFVNPWKDNSLTTEQADYLKYIITTIQKNIKPDLTDTEIQQKIATDDIAFFQVPLIKASAASKIHTEGWVGWLKNKLRRFHKDNIKSMLSDIQSEFLNADIESSYKHDNEIFNVINLMEQGSGESRKELIENSRSKYGDGFFERDLEAILSQHIWAYTTTRALKDRMPLIKSAFIAINVMGNEQNYDFSTDKEFIHKYVNNKINHQSIVDEKLKPYHGAIKALQQATSWMALAFSPVQFTYQSVEAIWKDIKLIITKPDGSDTFTANNMYNAGKIVYKELRNYSDIPTVVGAINAQYGINDMDNAAFAENNTSNRHGLFNFFGKFAYKFSSRPDFYSRMTIFVSQMLQDGSYKAHSVNEKGELTYDYSKDQRFKAFANNDQSNIEEYNKSKALYYAVARQLVKEGATNPNGTLFMVGQSLPKAYSNKESEAKKAVGDQIYGYYDSSKKSMFQGMLLGSLLMQMRTWWSAKKNQYLAPGGIKAQGKWVQAEEELIDSNTHDFYRDEQGNPIKFKLYYAKDEKGNIDANAPLVSENDPNCSKVPFMQWKGKFEEGVLITLVSLAIDTYQNKSIRQAWNNKFGANVDPELKKAYESNIKLLFTDLVMAAIIGGLVAGALGDWADDEEKEARKSGHMDDAIMATAVGLLYRTINNSAMDFLWWNSIFDISMDWNPMSLVYFGNQLNLVSEVFTGEADAVEVAVKSFSAARQVRPILECLRPKDD